MSTRKELTDAYKQKKFRMGVFQIRNTVNGKIMVDSSPNLDAIWNRHKFELNFGAHKNKELQKEWNEFGEDRFVFEIVSELKEDESVKTDPQKELKVLLALYMDELKPYGAQGYHPAPK